MHAAVVVEQMLAKVPGGIGRYTAGLAAALASTAARDDRVMSWSAWHRDVTPARLPGVVGPRRLPLGRRALAVAWRHGVGPIPRAADVVHAPSLLLPPRAACPVVVTIHDAVPWTHPETLTPRGAAWHRAMAVRAVRHAAAIATPTNAVADELASVLTDLPPGRLHVLGGGVATALLAEPSRELREQVRRRLALPDRFLFSVATLEPRKGLDVLVAALARLGSQAPPLLVAGQPGWGGIELAAVARSAGLADGAVRMLGRINDAALGVVLREATALVSPSRAEGFGLPVAEAMALGTPVICSQVPALVEVAGAAALVVPVGDADALAQAIEALLGDEAMQQRLGVAGLERAARYTWAAVAERAWAVYRAVTSECGR